jgi:hypothetical protein
MDIKKMPKNAKIFTCQKCNFTCSKLSNYNKHLSTAKHKKETLDTQKMPKNATSYVCSGCNKSYKYNSGLWKHKLVCKAIKKTLEPTTNNVIASIMKKQSDITEQNNKLMEENRKLTKTILEKIPNIQPNINNNQYNINIFLNERCKDAMNIKDFIASIQLTLHDLETIGTKGQALGVSNIIIDKLKMLDMYKRPLHCSDLKQETIYVKDDDKWEVDNGDKAILKNAIDNIKKKSIESLPTFDNCSSINSVEYSNTVHEIFKDPTENDKIISEIAKEVTIV